MTFVLNKAAATRLKLPPQLFPPNHPGIRRSLGKWYAEKVGIDLNKYGDDPYFRVYQANKQKIWDKFAR